MNCAEWLATCTSWIAWSPGAVCMITFLTAAGPLWLLSLLQRILAGPGGSEYPVLSTMPGRYGRQRATDC